MLASASNPWANKADSMTSNQRAKFRTDLIEAYEAGHRPGRLICMVSGIECDEKDIAAAHIWPAAANKKILHDFGLHPADARSFRNGFLAVKKIEEAFDRLRLGTILGARSASPRFNNTRVLMLAAAKTSVTYLPLSRVLLRQCPR